MKRGIISAVILVMTPVALAQTPAEKLVGVWSCSADFDYEVQTWQVGYFDTGRMVRVQQDNSLRVTQYDPETPEAERPKVEDAEATPNETSTEGVWRIRKDGKLVEQLKRIIDVSIWIEGKKRSTGMTQDLPPNALDAEEVVSVLKFKPDGNFTATASDGIVTNCVSKKSP